jgi:HAD superfamily hydrolase (TIGR01490 family)
MKLALFDLDDTLLDGDSEVLWCDYLTREGIFDMTGIREFMQSYREGGFDFAAFMRFQLRPLARLSDDELASHRATFLERDLFPRVSAVMRARLDEHRGQGHVLVGVSAAHDFLAEPIFERLGLDAGLCTMSERRDGRYTGEFVGTPCFAEGKIVRLDAWLASQRTEWKAVSESWFYSDSYNDLPLLERVEHAVAVRPDSRLRAVAQATSWEIVEEL